MFTCKCIYEYVYINVAHVKAIISWNELWDAWGHHAVRLSTYCIHSITLWRLPNTHNFITASVTCFHHNYVCAYLHSCKGGCATTLQPLRWPHWEHTCAPWTLPQSVFCIFLLNCLCCCCYCWYCIFCCTIRWLHAIIIWFHSVFCFCFFFCCCCCIFITMIFSKIFPQFAVIRAWKIIFK